MKEVSLVNIYRPRPEYIDKEIEVSVDGVTIDEYSDIPYQSCNAFIVQDLLGKLSQNGAINLKVTNRTEQ